MYVPLERLIDGVIASLREEVLPEVGGARARSRLWAVVDVLANLRDRIELRAAYAEAEVDSAAEALRGWCAAMHGAGRTTEAAETAVALEAALARPDPPVARAAALRALVVDALLRTAAGDEVPAALAALEAHLTAQAIRDVLPLKPSLLEEISKG